jgi:glycine/D-amino acid oxidase-like deaminating enzyme
VPSARPCVAEVEERARQWRARGAPVELCDAAQTRALTGTGAYAASLLDRRAGTIQPLAYVRGLARRRCVGAHIHTSTRVIGAERAGDDWLITCDTGCGVRARWIIVATDAYTAPQGLWGGLRTEQVKLPYFNLATAPLPQELLSRILPGRQGACDTRQVLSTFRLDGAGRMVFGSVGVRPENPPRLGSPRARTAVSQLKDVGFEHEWYGNIGMTPDAVPRFHQLDRNVVSFSGFNGRGIAPGTVLGRELAKLVLGEIDAADLPLPITPVRSAPLRVLREAGYEAGAQLVHLAGARIGRDR